jgi:hypothetical protein
MRRRYERWGRDCPEVPPEEFIGIARAKELLGLRT